MKPLSKINQSIQVLSNQYIDLLEFDPQEHYTIRDGHIVANIRTYDSFTTDDLPGIISKLNRLEYTSLILEEFDEERLWNIYLHCVHGSLINLFDHTDTTILKLAYQKYIKKNNQDHIPPMLSYTDLFERFSKRKNNSPTYFDRYIKKTMPYDYHQTYLHKILEVNFNQTGRSGGWLTICPEKEATISDHDLCYLALDNLTDNDEFNKKLRYHYIETAKDKAELIHDLKQGIHLFNERIKAIDYYIDTIQKKAASFLEDVVIPEIEFEIEEYCLEGEQDEPNVDIHLCNDYVKTTLGVKIPIDEFTQATNELIQFLKDKPTNQVFPYKKIVHNFYVDQIYTLEHDTWIKAGCHLFSLNQICQTLQINLPQSPVLTNLP